MLLIDMLIADCFVPLLPEPALADGYQLIRYHKRGWVGSTHTPPPVSIADHAADAAALLEHLGVRRAHIAGHSTGASIGAQLALDHPEKVHTLTLLEPTLVSLPLGGAFLEAAGPVFEAYAKRRPRGRVRHVRDRRKRPRLGRVSSVARGADPGRGCAVDQGCRHLLRSRAARAVAEWTFGPEQAAAIRRPVLSVIGAETQPLWVEIAEFLRSSLPHVEECTIDGVGHLLQIHRRHLALRVAVAEHPHGAASTAVLQADSSGSVAVEVPEGSLDLRGLR